MPRHADRNVVLKPFSASLVLTSANTEYALDISPGTRVMQLRSRTSSHVIRFSATKGVVAGGAGMPMEELDVQIIGIEDGPPLAPVPLYFASPTAGAIVEIFGTVEVPQ
jgi:hypothetical protein